ncbi:helix-turn-helix transcriptional regulator [Paenibacillus tarimensis]
MSKADNMLAILWLLRSRKRMTAKQLAEHLEVHIRTVYRLIDALCVSGVPVVSETGRSGGYYIPDHFTFDPLFFELVEQKSLVHAAAFAREAGYPFGEALQRAIAKLKRHSSPEQLNHLERHETGLEVIHPPSNPPLERLLRQLEQSIADTRSVRMNYQTGYEGPTETRTIDPYGLVHWKSKWYVVGYCRLRREIRCFRADRILSLSETDTVFQRPADFSARQFLLNSLLTASEDERHLITVHIEGSSQAINDLCGHWLFGHALVERAADRAHFKMDELTLYTQAPYFLLSYGGKIRILSPSELKSCMVEITASLLEYYQS